MFDNKIWKGKYRAPEDTGCSVVVEQGKTFKKLPISMVHMDKMVLPPLTHYVRSAHTFTIVIFVENTSHGTVI